MADRVIPLPTNSSSTAAKNALSRLSISSSKSIASMPEAATALISAAMPPIPLFLYGTGGFPQKPQEKGHPLEVRKKVYLFLPIR